MLLALAADDLLGIMPVRGKLEPRETIAACFGIEAARSISIRPLRASALAVVHLSHAYNDTEYPVILPADDAFLLMLYLVNVDHRDIWPDRPPAPLKTYREGSICLISLQRGAAIAVRGKFEALAFHIPVPHFTELAQQAGTPQIHTLETCRGVDDQIVRDIGAALMPMFDMPDYERESLLSPIALAINAHLVQRYGRWSDQDLTAAGQLSQQQEARVRSYIAANISHNISVEDLARETGLSTTDLADGFHASMGQSVPVWLAKQRIDIAQSLLSKTGQVLAEVAKQCGFADEKALHDAFEREVGTTPARWRLRDRH